MRLGISICEDVWNDRDFWKRRRYHQDPIEALAKAGAQAIVNLSASPFTVGKQMLREEMLGHMARKYGLPVAIVNQVGANDDLIFDGRSSVFDAQGKLFARAKGFEEDVLAVDLLAGTGEIASDDFLPEAEIWNALVLGVRDYARKTRFRKVLLGLSGGIDSALTAAIAADAMGPENVLGVMMPSRYSSQGSVDDSVELARNLGIRTMLLPISDIMKTYDGVLADAFAGLNPDVTEENIQSRIRGNLLMALSNKFGSLLLTTGNKSEMSVGYCTLYGDMNGGLGGDRGPAEDDGVPGGALAQPARRRSRNRPSPKRLRPSCGRIRPTRTACRPTICWTKFWNCTWSSAGARRRSSREGYDEQTVRRVLPPGAHRGVQEKAGCPGFEGDVARLRHRLADAHRTAGIIGGERGPPRCAAPGLGVGGFVGLWVEADQPGEGGQSPQT